MAVCPADTNEPPRVLNYLTAPHVYVWSAVACSSAFPLLFEPQELYARDHRGHTVKCALIWAVVLVHGPHRSSNWVVGAACWWLTAGDGKDVIMRMTGMEMCHGVF